MTSNTLIWFPVFRDAEFWWEQEDGSGQGGGDQWNNPWKIRQDVCIQRHREIAWTPFRSEVRGETEFSILSFSKTWPWLREIQTYNHFSTNRDLNHFFFLRNNPQNITDSLYSHSLRSRWSGERGLGVRWRRLRESCGLCLEGLSVDSKLSEFSASKPFLSLGPQTGTRFNLKIPLLKTLSVSALDQMAKERDCAGVSWCDSSSKAEEEHQVF